MILNAISSSSTTPSIYFRYRIASSDQENFINFSEVLSLDVLNDLAILKVGRGEFDRIKEDLIPLEIVATSKMPFPLKMPSPLKSVSYGFSLLLDKETARKTTFEAYESDKINPHTIHLVGNASAMEGMSGGPIMVQGKVIGVLKSGWNNLFYATKSDTLLSLLNQPFINKDFNALSSEITSGKKMSSSWLKAYRERFYFYVSHLYMKMGKENKALKLMEGKFNDLYIDYKLAQLFFKNGADQTGLGVLKHLSKKGINQANWDMGAILFEQDYDEWSKVKRYFKIAAMRGFGPSSYVMGMDAEARGSFGEAASWYLKSVYQGYRPAFFKLGDFYKEHNLKKSNIYHVKQSYLMFEKFGSGKGRSRQSLLMFDEFEEGRSKYNEIKEVQKQVAASSGSKYNKWSLCFKHFLSNY